MTDPLNFFRRTPGYTQDRLLKDLQEMLTRLQNVEGKVTAIGPQGPQGARGLSGESGPAGQRGESGQSAYELMVAEGFEGTEEDFGRALNALIQEWLDREQEELDPPDEVLLPPSFNLDPNRFLLSLPRGVDLDLGGLS